MKTINYQDYHINMGKLISVEEKNEFLKNKINNATNIPYEYLLYHYKELLNKNEAYYIICNKGQKSKRIVSILELYGYNVTNVVK